MNAFEVIQNETNFSEIPTGYMEDVSFEDFCTRNSLEIVEQNNAEATVRAEWGNGEGYDTFTVVFHS